MLHLIPAPLHRWLLRRAYAIRHRSRRIVRPHLRGVSVIARDAEGRVLLVRHSYGSGMWTLPGGGCGTREAPEAAARREMREELALEVGPLSLVAELQEMLSGSHHTAFVFTGTALGEAIPDGREIVAARFFPAGDLPAPLSPVAARRLAALAGPS